MKYPKVSIIILNWNGLEDTVECLESLKKITYPNYEVIIVDNGSTGDDVRILREQYGDYVHIIANDRNYGFAGGCNIGIRYALDKGTDYALLLNNDVIVDREFLSKLVEAAERDHTIGIVGSKVYYYHHPNRIQFAGVEMIWLLGHLEEYGEAEDVGQFDDIAERDFVYATSFLIKKAVIDKISLMDTYFFFYFEELEYCTRAKRAGFKVIYVPQSRVWHKAGASRARLPQFPEIQRLVEDKGGSGRPYKYYYRLLCAHFPPVLVVLPFILYFTYVGDLLFFLWRGDWQTIKRGIGKRLKYSLRVSNRPHIRR